MWGVAGKLEAAVVARNSNICSGSSSSIREACVRHQRNQLLTVWRCAGQRTTSPLVGRREFASYLEESLRSLPGSSPLLKLSGQLSLSLSSLRLYSSPSSLVGDRALANSGLLAEQPLAFPHPSSELSKTSSRRKFNSFSSLAGR